MALVGIIVAMGLGLFLISKTGGDELNLSEEAKIEKIWDESDLEDSSASSVFVPSPPPLDKGGSNNDSGDEKAQDHNTTRSNRANKHDGGDTGEVEDGEKTAEDHDTT